MPRRKEQFNTGDIFHIVVRALDENLIFKDVNDYYRGIFSIYEFNNSKPVDIATRRRDRFIEKKREKLRDIGSPTVLNYMKKIPSKLSAEFYDQIIRLHHQEFGYGRFDYKNWLDLLASKLNKGDRILDLGCGNGRTLKYFIDKGFAGTGIDVSAEMLELAKKHVPRGNFYKKEIEKVNFKANSFKAVVSFFALNHISKAQFKKVIIRCKRILNKEGFLLLGMVKGKDEGFFKGFYGKDLLLYGAGYTKKELLNILRACGYNIIKVGEKHFKGRYFEEDDVYILAKVKK